MFRLRSRSNSASLPSRAFRPSVEALEDRVVPAHLGALATTTAAPTFAPPSLLANVPDTAQEPGDMHLAEKAWIQANVLDPALQAQALAAFNDDFAIGRLDMLDLFGIARLDDVVTATELADLRALVANPDVVHMPDYVANLAGKVVNGDMGNSTYQFVQVYSGTGTGYVRTSYLGNLDVDSPSWQLDQLVDKWFRGVDAPTTGFRYAYDGNDSLFGAGIQYTDIDQGQLGDCYFLAALGDLANQSPQTIQNLFLDNQDGTYTVRFGSATGADYVTVDRWLPITAKNTFAYANDGQAFNSGSNSLWVPLLEKAYAQVNHSGWLGRADSSDSYAALENGFSGDAMRQLTGLTASRDITLTAMESQTQLQNAVSAGDLVCLNTPKKPNTTYIVDGIKLVREHVYSVLGYDASTGLYTVFNPWNVNKSGAAVEFQVNFWQIQRMFVSWDRGDNPENVIDGSRAADYVTTQTPLFGAADVSKTSVAEHAAPAQTDNLKPGQAMTSGLRAPGPNAVDANVTSLFFAEAHQRARHAFDPLADDLLVILGL
ncbi:MAG: C2 family cysteine protease [Gemmataceae bacterium]